MATDDPLTGDVCVVAIDKKDPSDSVFHARAYHTGAKIAPLVAKRQTYCV